jgi:iron complex outermembrane recepter protein
MNFCMNTSKKKISFVIAEIFTLGATIGTVSSVAAQTPTQAQAPTQPAAAPEKIEKIEVTGSRVPTQNLEGTSPVAVVDAQTIKADGLRSVENLLNNLPQVVADFGGTVSNGATGTATVNLRNLGSGRTLVLINGRRLPAGSPRIFSADLNQIPAPLIKRVEVLTGGAGAVYGSDAVAGVVNFIMNDRFEGAQFEVNQSFYNHKQNNDLANMIAARALSNGTQYKVPGDKSSDGKIFDANFLLGGNFANGKGNATLFLNYKKEDALLQSERDYSACSIGNSTTNSPSTINGIQFGPGFRCGGSGTSFPGLFITAAGNRTVANAVGDTRAYSSANDAYNFGPLNYFQRPSERYGANASANYDLTDWAKVYSEFSFHDDRTVAQLAPSGLFGFNAAGSNAIRFENPLLSADWRRDLGLNVAGDAADAVILRRNVEGGGRRDDIRHTSFRTVLGVKGEFAGVWNYDAFMQTGKVIYQSSFQNDLSNARIARALDVIRDSNGNIVCRSAADGSDTNCVPYNIWSLGGVTPAALAYLSTPAFQKGFTSQTVQGGTISGDLTNYGWKLPSAKSGVGVAFGVERRVEKLELETDTAFTTGDLAGANQTIGVGGKYTVKEIFGEARVPLIEGKLAAELLSMNASYRKSDYSTGPKTDSFGFGFEWAPNKAIRARTSYQEATRAADVIQLFSAQSLGLFTMNVDPCGPTRGATAAQCANTGLSPALYGNTLLDNPAGQYNVFIGGNPKLTPEESKSITAGFVLTPMKDFSATIDYFSIKVDKTIGTAPASTILSQCLQTGSPAFCSLITRDSRGTLYLLPAGRIVSTNLNLGRLETSGIDLSVNFKHKLATYGSLNWDFIGTLTKEFVFEPIPGLGSYDCVGLHGNTCGVPQPKWRHKLRAAWQTPWDVDLALTWRYFGKADNDGTSSNPLLSATVADADRTIAQQNYLDIAATWTITKQWTARAGINNLLDKDPPISGQTTAAFGNGNTYPQAYDGLGRRVFLNLTAKF